MIALGAGGEAGKIRGGARIAPVVDGDFPDAVDGAQGGDILGLGLGIGEDDDDPVFLFAGEGFLQLVADGQDRGFGELQLRGVGGESPDHVAAFGAEGVGEGGDPFHFGEGLAQGGVDAAFLERILGVDGGLGGGKIAAEQGIVESERRGTGAGLGLAAADQQDEEAIKKWVFHDGYSSRWGDSCNAGEGCAIRACGAAIFAYLLAVQVVQENVVPAR